jgi:hypothetical protein
MISKGFSISLLSALLLSLPAAADNHFETLGTVAANDFVPANLQTGPNHTVSSEASSDGFQNVYIVNSKYGAFQATGIEGLTKTVTEVDALAYLEAVSRAEVFVNALGDAGVQTASAIAKAFTSPVTTVRGIPDGIGRVFEGAQRGFGLATRMLRGNNSQKDGIEPEDFREMNYLVGDGQRKWAQELKTDPYTTNMKLRQTISNMSVVEFVGGLPVDIALPMGAGLAVGVIGDETEIYRQSAQLLEAANRTCLADLGVEPEQLEAFITANYLTPTTQTSTCNTLRALSSVEGSNQLVPSLAASESFEAADFLLQIAEMMVQHQSESAATLTSLVVMDGLPYAMSGDSPVIMLPAENLQWTEVFANRITAIDAKGTVIVSGTPSEMTVSSLASLGWEVSTVTNIEPTLIDQ